MTDTTNTPTPTPSTERPAPTFFWDTADRFGSDMGLKIEGGECLLSEAHYALDLIRTNGILAAKPDGEDSAARAKWAVMPPAELVTRAFDIAEAAYTEARKRGLAVRIPDGETVRTVLTAKRDAEDEARDAAKRARLEARKSAERAYAESRNEPA